MDYYEDYEAYATVYEDEISGCTWTQQDLDDCELKSEILIDEIVGRFLIWTTQTH